MAERRSSDFCYADAAAGWVVADCGITRQRFYAVLDATDHLTWTDQRATARHFPTAVEAELFAQDMIHDDDWTVLQ